MIAGKNFGLFGLKGFFLSPDVVTPGVAALFLFQLVFMDTAAIIPTGAGAERWKFTPSFVLFSCVSSTIIYPIFAKLGVGARRMAVGPGRELRARASGTSTSRAARWCT